jgi:deoxyribodipyrimidine photo-lyase
MHKLVWFRNDLRLYDNPALYHASKEPHSSVIGIYIFDPAMWKKHDVANCRVHFILRGLTKLSQDLAEINIPLLVHTVKNSIPEDLYQISNQYSIHALYFNRQYEFDEATRDISVIRHLEKNEITCHAYEDQTILQPGKVLTQQGDFFKNFTAFKRAWQTIFLNSNVKLLPKPKLLKPNTIIASKIPDVIAPFATTQVNPDLWPAGEKIAQKKLHDFIENNISDYEKTRDFPFLNQTSKLSPYLANGMLSARDCFLSALYFNQNELDSGNQGAITWMSELIWRDFYKHILVSTPRVSKNKPYQLETEKIRWNFNSEQLLAWQNGQTGFPIIDAAMRQLNTTGWMHNRLRMIVAMYFTKNLFFDWRLGEKYFMQNLIDGDLAANNGGWQWCASTGTDAVPYFRVFNPIRQSERFDPEGNFIRLYCPELAKLDNHSIHDPHGRFPIQANGYPKPTVDLKLSREYAIAKFKENRD